MVSIVETRALELSPPHIVEATIGLILVLIDNIVARQIEMQGGLLLCAKQWVRGCRLVTKSEMQEAFVKGMFAEQSLERPLLRFVS